MDLSTLIGLGSGLSTFGEGMTQRAIREQAEREREEQRKRLEQQDADEKAYRIFQETVGLDQRNYHPVAGVEDPEAMKRDLTNLALRGKGGDVYTSALSGQRFERAPGMNPNNIKAEDSDSDRMLKMLVESNRAAQNQQKLDQYDRPSGNVVLQQNEQTKRTGMQEEGDTKREGMRQTGATTRKGMATPSNAGSSGVNERQRTAAILRKATELTKDKVNKFGDVLQPGMSQDDAIAEATRLVDMASGKMTPSPGADMRTEEQESQRAAQAHAAIEAKMDLSPEEKAERHAAIDELMRKNIIAIRARK